MARHQGQSRQPRERSKPRSQLFVAVVLAVGIALGVAAVDRLPRLQPAESHGGGAAPSGAWFCPHGGGRGWNVWLSVANPGTAPVAVRIDSMGEEGPVGDPVLQSIPAMTTVTLRVPAHTRGSGSEVQFFDGFVGAGWVAQAGHGERGVAAEPCASTAGKRILLADATTVQDQDSWIILMNPFDAPASYTLHYLTEKDRPVETPEEVIRPHHGAAVLINERLLGEPTIGTNVEVGLGRLAAANLNIEPGDGGIRSVIGYPSGLSAGPAVAHVMPGGLDQGESKIVAMNPWSTPLTIQARLLNADQEQTATGLEGVSLAPETSMTRSVTTSSPATVTVTTVGTAVARRSFGTGGDQGGSGGAPPATDWVVLPAVTQTEPFEPRLLIANPGTQPVQVDLTLLPEGGIQPDKTTATLTVAPGTTGFADLPQFAPHAAVLVHAGSGVVPAFAAYSNDRGGYAVAVGVAEPASAA